MQYESYKTVEDSRTEWMKCIQYEDINGNGRLFGGRLMEWMDEVAGIAATRHAGGIVTTAAVDNLQFKFVEKFFHYYWFLITFKSAYLIELLSH